MVWNWGQAGEMERGGKIGDTVLKYNRKKLVADELDEGMTPKQGKMILKGWVW